MNISLNSKKYNLLFDINILNKTYVISLLKILIIYLNINIKLF